jgi:hypothetical protein
MVQKIKQYYLYIIYGIVMAIIAAITIYTNQ